MDTIYNQDYSKERIKQLLDVIHNCVRDNRFIVSLNENRQENIDFINYYNLSHKKQKDILK